MASATNDIASITSSPCAVNLTGMSVGEGGEIALISLFFLVIFFMLIMLSLFVYCIKAR